MLNYVAFYTRIWNDKKFKSLSPEARLLFIYMFSNSDVTLTGIYDLDVETCAFKIRIESTFDRAFDEVVNSKLVRWDAERDKLFVINRFKLIPNKSPKLVQGAINELNHIKHPFKTEFIEIYTPYLKDYLPNLKGYESGNDNLLNIDQIKAFTKLGWGKERVSKFYLDKNYNAESVAAILGNIFDRR